MKCKKCCKKDNCKKDCCTCDDIIKYLGEYLYCLLKDAIPKECHPSLNESLCALINGKSLPPCHPTLEHVICDALHCDDCDKYVPCNNCYNNNCYNYDNYNNCGCYNKEDAYNHCHPNYNYNCDCKYYKNNY